MVGHYLSEICAWGVGSAKSSDVGTQNGVTAMAIHRLKLRDVERATRAGMYSDGLGLYLQVGEGGDAKSWIFRYSRSRFGKSGDAHMGLGPTHTVSLDEARELARTLRQQLLNGIDPLEARKADRLAKRLEASKHVTFAECAADYIAHKSRTWRATTTRQAKRAISKHLNPAFKDLPITEMNHLQLHKVLEPMWTSQPPWARTVLIHLKGIFDRAKAKGFRPGDNPASLEGPLGLLLHDIRDIHTVQHHDSLPYQEVGALMARLRTPPEKPTAYTLAEAAEATGIDRSAIQRAIYDGRLPAQKNPGIKFGAPWFVEPDELFKLYPRKNAPAARPRMPLSSYILQFVILTAVRFGQVQRMRWDECDLPNKLWTCPWQRTKNGRKTKKPHLIPLSEPAIKILEQMREEQKTSGVPSEFVFAHGRAFTAGYGALEGKPVSDNAVRDHLRRHCDRPDVTIHGFRASFSSWANDNNFPRDCIEMALDHLIGNQVERIYARDAQRLDQRRRLMESWAEYCGRAEPLPGDVIPFRQAK
jgi:integrase